jgi:hypothetical protein
MRKTLEITKRIALTFGVLCVYVLMVFMLIGVRFLGLISRKKECAHGKEKGKESKGIKGKLNDD